MNFTRFLMYILIGLIVFVACFHIVFCDSNASALPSYELDSSAWSVLEGTGGAYTEGYDYYLNADPNMFVFGVDHILNDINSKLYDQYGWDLETLSWEIEDSMTEAVKTNFNRKLALGTTIAQGFNLYESTLINQLTGAKDYILGKLNTTTGKIDQVYNNVYTYVSDDLINKMTSIKTDLIEDQTLYNFSQANHYLYGSNFHFVYGSWNNYTLQFSHDVVLTSWSQANGYYSIGIISQYNSNVHIPCSGVCVDVGISRSHPIEYCYIEGAGSQKVINGTTYYVGQLVIHCTDNSTFYPYSAQFYGNGTTVLNNLNSYDNSGYYDYDYNNSSYLDFKAILDELKGNWVTTDDLRQINEKLNELTLGNIVIDGSTLPVIDTDSSKLAELENLIHSILDSNEFANDELGDPEPEPEPNPNYTIPEELWPSFFPDLMPDDMFSMFKPVFDIVGTNYSMYNLWILIPSILIFILVIYIIVSLL